MPAPAGRFEDAHSRRHPEPTAGGPPRRLHEDIADVVVHPLVEDRIQERPELFRLDRPLRYRVALLVDRPAVVVDPLDDGDETASTSS